MNATLIAAAALCRCWSDQLRRLIPVRDDTVAAIRGGAVRSDLIRTMEHSLARWVTYHLASAVGLGVAGVVLAALIFSPMLRRRRSHR